jgi:hypothetical protein
MKKILFPLFVALALASCSERTGSSKARDRNDTHSDGEVLIIPDTAQDLTEELLPREDEQNSPSPDLSQTPDTTKQDSTLWLDHSLFKDLKLTFRDISEKQFDEYLSEDTPEDCQFSDLNLKADHFCDEICVTILKEVHSHQRMFLPCSYDSGILNLSFSPDCQKLMVCSSYDGPDFENYYDHRAEFYVFGISGSDGLNSLSPLFQFATKEWSIDKLVWINSHTIGLKIYTEQRTGDGSQTNYQYVETTIPSEK